MGTRAVERGRAGVNVARNVKTQRELAGYTLQDLSARMARVGRPILTTGLSKIEQGTRRVDVDDLVALADALGTTPGGLLSEGSPAADLKRSHENRRRLYAAEWLQLLRKEGLSDADIAAGMDRDDRDNLPDHSEPEGDPLKVALVSADIRPLIRELLAEGN